MGDPTRLNQILLNLAGNAIKFTKKGSVNLSVNRKNEFLIYEVRDTGIGIPEDKFEEIFEHFSRLTPAYEGLYEGAGLGLYTVKRYIGVMQGTIDVASEVGAGTCFTVMLPFTVSDRADKSRQLSTSIMPLIQNNNDRSILEEQGAISAKDAKASVLVVEDNQLAAVAVMLSLKALHCHAATAESGVAAVNKLQSEHYDLILMDIGLPGMNGIETTKKIRNLADINKSQVPIIALTGHGDNPDMRQQALAAGMQGVICKPIRPPALKSILGKFGFNVSGD